MAIRLERCSSGSLETLVEVSRKTFHTAFAHMNDPKDFQTYMQKAFSTSQLQQELACPDSTFFFTYKDRSLAGYFKLNRGKARTDLHETDSMELERIYVLDTFQGQGIGERMLMEAKKRASEAGVAFLWLGVWEANTNAIRFYERHGFVKFDKHPYYIGSDRQMDWLMRHDLH